MRMFLESNWEDHVVASICQFPDFCMLKRSSMFLENVTTYRLNYIMSHYYSMVRHPRCVFINYNWINQLLNTTIWWLDICCLLHRYQLHVSALMAIFRLID